MSHSPDGAIHVLADIGGTNARFAVCGTDGIPREIRRVTVRDYPRFRDALADYADGRAVTSVAIAAAGPVVEGAVRLTNADWIVSVAEARSVCPGAKVHILNDLAAVALALPVLTGGDSRPLHTCEDIGPAPMLALNVGTGFGAAVAVPVGTGWTALATEAGHMSLLPTTADHALFDAPTTVEGILSGPALARLRTLVTDREVLRQDFSRVLGRVAGDLVLATGAWGGLYLCGGVLADLEATLDTAAFLGAMHDRSGVAARLAAVPVHHIQLAEPALLGLGTLN